MQALVVFENVVGLEPKNYIGDNMQKVTDVYRIAQYNVACCYSMIAQTDAAMDALKAALISGFDDYKCASHPPPTRPPRHSPYRAQLTLPRARIFSDSVNAVVHTQHIFVPSSGRESSSTQPTLQQEPAGTVAPHGGLLS